MIVVVPEIWQSEKTLFVSFFYRLPLEIRTEYMEWYNEILGPDDLDTLRICEWLDFYMKDISPEKFEFIMKYTDDYTYFSFINYYEILQPVIETIVNGNELFNKYPEYLI